MGWLGCHLHLIAHATTAATQVLDRYFGNVCELDIIFNFHKVRRPQARSACRGEGHRGARGLCLSAMCVRMLSDGALTRAASFSLLFAACRRTIS